MTTGLATDDNIAATIAALVNKLRAQTPLGIATKPAIADLDSMRLVELVLKLEDIYAIRLNADDIDAITSLDTLAAIVSQRRAETVSPVPAPLPSPPKPAPATFTFILDFAEMRGPSTRLGGAIAGPLGTITTILAKDGTPLLTLAPQTGRFDELCGLDLAHQNLTECRLSITFPGSPAAEWPLPRLPKLIFPALADGAPNRLHLTAALRDDITQPTPSELLQNFETLGDNCEFGVFAGMLGDHRASLFRAGGTSEWMTVPRPGQLSLPDAIDNHLAGFAEHGDLRLEYIFGEWMAFSNRYDFCFHTGEKNPAAPVPPLATAQLEKLARLKQDFLNDLANPAKIFVRKSNGRETEADIDRLLTALRRHGDPWLLWLAPATETIPPATVTLFPNKLLHVTIANLASYTRADRINALSWFTALTAAHLVLATLAAR
jgi:acyl carrier protein